MKRDLVEKILLGIGAVLICLGIFTKVPGGALTTYTSLNGKSTDGYAAGTTYTTIDEYVGGDAYNFIIGASLVGGKIAGAQAAKAMYISSGAIIIALGLFLMANDNNPSKNSPTQPVVNEEPKSGSSPNIG